MSEAYQPVAAASTSAERIELVSPAPAASVVARSARGRPADDADTRHSKTLSYILRHGAAKENLVLREDGFVRVEQLMKRPKLKGLDFATLERIVRDNAKQRFTMREEVTGDAGQNEWWIRANQGHSVTVEDLELERITRVEQAPIVVHGTYLKNWDAISKEGLKVMTRNHLHCAIGLAGEEGVTSGMRTSCDLYIYLNVALLLQDSIQLFRSTNDVILTSGIDGVIAPKYFAQVITKAGKVLV